MHLLSHTGAELGIEMLLVIAKHPSPSKFTYQLKARYGGITDIFWQPGDFIVTSGIDTLHNVEQIIENYAPKYNLFVNFLGHFGSWHAFFPHLGDPVPDEFLETVDFNGLSPPPEIIDLTSDEPPKGTQANPIDLTDVGYDD